MPYTVYVQLRDQDKPCIVPGKNVAEGKETLIVKNEQDEVVGKFKSDWVIGWWVQFDQ